jgi:hypothetical protein
LRINTPFLKNHEKKHAVKAVLALADGRIFEGTAFGAQGEVNGFLKKEC